MQNIYISGSASLELAINITVEDADFGNNSLVTFHTRSFLDDMFHVESVTDAHRTLVSMKLSLLVKFMFLLPFKLWSPSQGYITLTRELDRESNLLNVSSSGEGFYHLTIVATDHGLPPQTAIATVWVSLTHFQFAEEFIVIIAHFLVYCILFR